MNTVLRWIATPFGLVLAFVLAVLFGYFIAYTIDFSLSQSIGLHIPTDLRTQIAQLVGYGGAAWLVILVPAYIAPSHQRVVAIAASAVYWVVQIIGFIGIVAGLVVGYGLVGNLLRIVAAVIGTGVGISQVWEEADFDW